MYYITKSRRSYPQGTIRYLVAPYCVLSLSKGSSTGHTRYHYKVPCAAPPVHDIIKMMTQKTSLITIVVLIALLGAGVYVGYQMGSKAGYGEGETSGLERGKTIGYDEGYEKGKKAGVKEASVSAEEVVSNPLEEAPSANPFEGSTNPFEDYTNPFE